ncbi:MAG: tail fiber protein [Rikenellaceae bacterium]|nr:tail fiber protein [Rikenellaceae bacterium]
MDENYIGEIRSFAFGFVPNGWHTCDGAILNIQQYQALYSLISNQFGGDGKYTFALPDLRGRSIVSTYVSAPQPYKNGDYAGVENVTLNKTNLPPHFHMMVVENAPGDVAIMTNRLAIPDYKAETTEIIQIYSNDESSQVTLNPDTIKAVGNAAQHPNRQPYLTINYCIAMVGIYPTRPY